jgi:invasion protein IalB
MIPLELDTPMTHRTIVRIAVSAALAGSVLLGLASSADAQVKKPEPTKVAPAKAAPVKSTVAATDGQPTQLGTFGSWNVYASDTANGRVCYALAIPKERLPANLTRDPGYFFVSTRPKENVRDELSIVLGFPAKEGADAQLVIGKSNFAASPKMQVNTSVAWLKNPQDNASVIEQMKKNPLLSLKVTSKRGNALTENYALAGFAQALDQVKKACP